MHYCFKDITDNLEESSRIKVLNIGLEQKFVAFFSLKLYIQYFRQK